LQPMSKGTGQGIFYGAVANPTFATGGR
jgi:hypothetical protein